MNEGNRLWTNFVAFVVDPPGIFARPEVDDKLKIFCIANLVHFSHTRKTRSFTYPAYRGSGIALMPKCPPVGATPWTAAIQPFLHRLVPLAAAYDTCSNWLLYSSA